MPSLISYFRSLYRNLVNRTKADRELDEELRAYVELAVQRKVTQGLSETDARRQVLVELEGAEQTKETIRQQRAGYRLEMLVQDLRFAVRSLRKAPVFSLTILAVLTLGIGSTTLMFAIVNSVLLEGPPYPDADRLVSLWQRIPEEAKVSFSPNELVAWKKQTQLFENLAFVTGTGFTLSGCGDPELITGRIVSPELFAVLRSGAFLGRAFAETDANQHVVIASYALWRQKFSSRPDVIGQSLSLDGEAYTIIGVLPESFQFEAPEGNLFVPASLNAPLFVRHPDAHFLKVFGRLKPGVTREQLDAEVNLLGTRVDDPNDRTSRRYFALSLQQLTAGELRTPLTVLLGAVVFLLLVACANVANLVLARTHARQTELAVRAALGASRGRLMWQLLSESAVLACTGGLLGTGLAVWALVFLASFAGSNVPELVHSHTGVRALVVAMLASGFTAIVFGLGPAWSASSASFGTGLKAASRSSTGTIATRQFLVFAELAIAAALLVCCTLLVRSFTKLVHTDPGFRPNDVVTADVFLPKQRYPDGPQLFQFYRAALDKIQNLPGVETVGMVTHLPFGGNNWGNSFDVEGYVAPAGVDYSAQIRPVSPGYFNTLGIPLIEGRGFVRSDDEKSPPVAIVNLALAKRFWPNGSPIGKRVRYYGNWLSVVGVCGNIKHSRLDAESDMEIYVPYPQLSNDVAQFVGRDLNYVARSRVPAAAGAELRDGIHAIDPQLVVKVNTMEALIHQSTAQPRFRTWLVTVFSISAVVLACLGIYGVIAYLVTQRYRELGIRLALGATRRNILQLVLGRTAILATAGITAGIGAALFLSRFLRSMLYGISVHDPVTFVGVPLCLLVIGVLAAYLPARGASQLDPVTCLRYE
jgi:putative ABC transport system permease protein